MCVCVYEEQTAQYLLTFREYSSLPPGREEWNERTKTLSFLKIKAIDGAESRVVWYSEYHTKRWGKFGVGGMWMYRRDV